MWFLGKRNKSKKLKHTAILYDYIYQNPTKVRSIYAQIFGGYPSLMSEGSQSSDKRTKKGEGNIQMLKGGYSAEGKEVKEHKKTIEPHDRLITDMLSELASKNYLHTILDHRKAGDLILAKGGLTFINNDAIQFITDNIGSIARLINIDKNKSKRLKKHSIDF